MKKHNTVFGAGFSLIETLVVITIFSALAIIATQSTLSSLAGARKSENTLKIRSNLEFAMSIIERRVRNAKSVDVAACNSSNEISITDELNQNVRINCTGGYVAINGQRLTSQEIAITNCDISCTAAAAGVPPQVQVSLTGEVSGAQGVDRTQVTVSNNISTRVY